MDLSGFPDLLDKAFLEYRIKQTRQRLSVSLNSFAGFLDFSPPIVNMWLTGNRLPSQANVERLIPKLVELLDVEVYDTLGLPRPDQNLQRLTQAWPRIPVPFRQILAEQAEKYAVEGEHPADEKAGVENAVKEPVVQKGDLVSKKAEQAEKNAARVENPVNGKAGDEIVQKDKIGENGDLVSKKPHLV